jgi:predicted HTH transcriptional regulator
MLYWMSIASYTNIHMFLYAGSVQLKEVSMTVKSSNFDQQPVLGTSLDDLNVTEVEEHLNHARRVNRYQGQAAGIEEMLFEQRAVVEVDGKLIPTVAGLLFFGRWPQRYLPRQPSAWCIIVAIRSTARM